MLRKAVYPKIEATINAAARFLDSKGLTPNQLTLGGLALNFITGLVFANGLFFLGGLLMLLAGIGDMLDGPLARVTGRASRFGAFLDSTVDRYSDFFLFSGIALFYAKSGLGGAFLLVMAILMGSFVTSYAKARAENLIPACGVGIFERTERILVLAVGTLITPLLPLALWVLAIGTNATAIHRIVYTRKFLSDNAASFDKQP